MKKVTKKQSRAFWSLIWSSFFIILIFTVFDLIGKYMWFQIGGWEGAAYQKAGDTYQMFYWTLCDVILITYALMYYKLRRDKTEAVAIFLVPFLMFQFGLEDLMFYLLHGLFFQPLNILNHTLPWLEGNLIPVTFLANVLNNGVISGGIVVLSSVIGVFLAMWVAAWLEYY